MLGRVQAVIETLAEPNRRRILDELLPAERSVGELVAAVGLSQPSVSKHLRVLRDAGLVTVRVRAQRRIYRLRPEPLQALDDWLAPYRRQWGARLDDLARHLDELDERDRRAHPAHLAAPGDVQPPGDAGGAPADDPGGAR